MERLNGYETWHERDRLNDLSSTELIQYIIDANEDILENPYRLFETLNASTIAAQILASRDFFIAENYND